MTVEEFDNELKDNADKFDKGLDKATKDYDENLKNNFKD